MIIGFTNSGKSSLISLLTNAKPKISEAKYITTFPEIGIMGYKGTSIQLIEIPSLGSAQYDKGLANTADTILILITNLKQINEI